MSIRRLYYGIRLKLPYWKLERQKSWYEFEFLWGRFYASCTFWFPWTKERRT